MYPFPTFPARLVEELHFVACIDWRLLVALDVSLDNRSGELVPVLTARHGAAVAIPPRGFVNNPRPHGRRAHPLPRHVATSGRPARALRCRPARSVGDDVSRVHCRAGGADAVERRRAGGVHAFLRGLGVLCRCVRTAVRNVADRPRHTPTAVRRCAWEAGSVGSASLCGWDVMGPVVVWYPTVPFAAACNLACVLLAPTRPPRDGTDPLDMRYVCDACGVCTEDASQHCYSCGVCVAGYDHHCPLVGTCVGKGNVAVFYTFFGAVAVHFSLVVIALTTKGVVM